MILDLAATGRLDVASDAVVVVGAGAAGIAVTEALAAAGRSVVLLESGPDVASGSSTETDDLNAGTSSGASYFGLSGARTRVIGGAAQLWHGQCMRLFPIDLEARSWVKHSGWPIEYSELARHYLAAEKWIDVSGRGYGGERWAEHADLPPLDWDARRLLHDFTEYTPRPYLGTEHRAVLAADPLVSVYVNATVARVGVSPQGQVSGVEVAAPGGARFEVGAHTVVLCGGAIENARLLQLSDPAGVGLGDGREHVGRFLQDHPVVVTAEVDAPDYRVLQDRYVAVRSGGRRLFPKVRLAPAAQREYGLLDATAVFQHEHDRSGVEAARRLIAAARARQRPAHGGRDARAALAEIGPMVRDAYRRYARGRATAARPASVGLQIWLEQQPDRDSRLTLGPDTDALGLRRTHVHWQVGDLEMETSRRMTSWIGDDLQRLGVATLREHDMMRDDAAWQSAVRDAYHPAGTTRMSSTPTEGVVDPDLQVHGVAGLHIVGGSVFPISGYANPTLTIVALALRLADHLA